MFQRKYLKVNSAMVIAMFLSLFLSTPLVHSQTLIDQNSIDTSRASVIPEMYENIKAGQFMFYTMLSKELNDQNSSSSNIPSNILSQEDSDKVLHGLFKVLSPKFIEASYSINSFYDKKNSFTYTTNISRLENNDPAYPLLRFKEILQFITPASSAQNLTQNFNFYTYRLNSNAEDDFYEISPFIKRLRQLTGSNRSDSLFYTAFSPDDFFVWSGKQNLVALDHIEDGRWYVPSSSIIGQNTKTEETIKDNCIVSMGYKEKIFNFETKFSSNAPDWLAKTPFIKKDLYRVILKQKDYYSTYGDQIIYLDKTSLLPIIKVVLDERGRAFKIVYRDYPERKNIVPNYIVAVSFASDENSVLINNSGRVCTAKPTDFDETVFDANKTLNTLYPKREILNSKNSVQETKEDVEVDD